MITSIYSVVALPGKDLELVAAMKELVQIGHDHLAKEIHVARSIGGNPSRFSWLGQLESLGQVDDQQRSLMSNPEYPHVLRKFDTLVVPRSARHLLLSHI